MAGFWTHLWCSSHLDFHNISGKLQSCLKKNWTDFYFTEVATADVLQKNVFFKISWYLQQTPVLKPVFNKVTGLIKKKLWHIYLPVNIKKFLRKHYLKNICEQLLQTYESLEMKLMKEGQELNYVKIFFEIMKSWINEARRLFLIARNQIQRQRELPFSYCILIAALWRRTI